MLIIFIFLCYKLYYICTLCVVFFEFCTASNIMSAIDDPDARRECVVCRSRAHLKCPCEDQIPYCGPECQKNHWNEHKLTCSTRRQRSGSIFDLKEKISPKNPKKNDNKNKDDKKSDRKSSPGPEESPKAMEIDSDDDNDSSCDR